MCLAQGPQRSEAWTQGPSVSSQALFHRATALPARGHMFYIGLLKVKTWKNLFVWNHKAQSLDIWYVASPSGLLPSLFK